MISAKQAAEHAAEYLSELVPVTSKPIIEEVEKQEAPDRWILTLSYTIQENSPFLTIGGARHYKQFVIDGNDGEILSMKIRSIK